MSENKVSENKEGVEIKPPKRKLSIRTKALNVAGSALAGAAALALAADHEAKPVSAAQDNTPTPISTPARTPIPDAGATRVANLQATVDARAKELEQMRRLANLNRTATAITEEERALRNTPTPTTPTPPPAVAAATSEAARLEVLGRVQAEIKATATRNAELTETAVVRQEATAAARQATADARQATAEARQAENERRRNQGDGPPGIFAWLGGGLLAVGGMLGFKHRNRIGNWLTPARDYTTATLDRMPDPIRNSRVVTAIRTRLHI